ncbi:hypothetical protein CHL67_05500 [Prosthecochloris sp. GSB1]|nr:hypothetical protein CHL67_05500 [Prosthecochloris sp. GSB1]
MRTVIAIVSLLAAAQANSLIPLAYGAPGNASNPLIEKADAAFYAMDYRLADSLYTLSQDIHPGDPSVYWKLSRLYVSMGETILPEETEARRPYFEKAVEFAETCTEIDDTVPEGHTWLAASLGVLSDNAGPREKIKRANIIKNELERALQLNPRDDVALSILGSFHREIADIGWLEKVFAKTFLGSLPKGSREEAEKYLKKAIAYNPRVIRHYHELGKLYIDMDRYDEARSVLEQALTRPVLMKSDERRLRNIRLRLEELSEKTGS